MLKDGEQDVLSLNDEPLGQSDSLKNTEKSSISNADTSNGEMELSSLEEKIEKLEKELMSQKDLYLRLAAEYDNYRKRTERDRLLIYDDATANTVTNILPIADSLDAAIKFFNSAPAEYKKGIDLLANQLNVSFEKLGIKSFGAEGDVFDPKECEAIQHVDDDSLGENVIVEVLRKGYKINNRVIRCAMVRVAN